MLIVDTNILLAAAETSVPEHPRCAAVLDDHTDLAVTAAVAVVDMSPRPSLRLAAADGYFASSWRAIPST